MQMRTLLEIVSFSMPLPEECGHANRLRLSRPANARSWLRFLHTGEALGLIGQAVAGAASAGSLVMIWTGLALAYRRLVAPIFVRR
jgi:uncharacterized iron-regulated membrane protein